MTLEFNTDLPPPVTETTPAPDLESLHMPEVEDSALEGKQHGATPTAKQRIVVFLKIAGIALLRCLVMLGIAGVFYLLFGSQNMLIGFAFGMGVVVFSKISLHIRPKEASISMLTLALFTGGAATLSMLNPWLGLVVNTASIFVIMLFSGQKTELRTFSPFLLCYMFVCAEPVFGGEFGMRMLAFAVGGILLAITYYIFHRKETHVNSVLAAIKTTKLLDPNTKFFLRMSAGIAIAVFIGTFFHFEHAYWIPVTVFSITSLTLKETHSKLGWRIAGTIVGGIIFYLLLEFLVPTAFAPLLLALVFYIYMVIKPIWLQQIFSTLAGLLGAALFFSPGEALQLRFELVVIGVTIVIILNIISHFKILDKFYKNVIIKGKAHFNKCASELNVS